METSILLSTKQILGLAPDDDAFDLDVITHINTALSVLLQLGVLNSSVTIENPDTTWDSIGLSAELTNMARSYIFLKTQMLWDTPTTSYLIKAREDQIAELEYRMKVFSEEVAP